jgi:hypothetical protein
MDNMNNRTVHNTELLRNIWVIANDLSAFLNEITKEVGNE